MIRKSAFLVSFILVFSLVIAGCGVATKPAEVSKVESSIILATTTSTKDSGLLDVLLPAFTKETGIEVKVISQGTGQAIKTAEMGDCDVILVHARASEDKFMADGFGVNRKDVMYNDFVILGPKNDPVGVKGLKVVDALQKLNEGKGTFISRGDDSGTHKKELGLWKRANIEPKGDWYKSVGKGMGDTINMANELLGYTLADRATYLAMMNNIELNVVVEGDDSLFNPYGVIAVNPDKQKHVKYEEAMKFIEFITSDKGKELINGYKRNGHQLFYVN